MKILYFGAGVIGSITAAKLGVSGHDITVLERGERLVQVRDRGIVIRHGVTGEETHIRPAVIETLGRDDYYDMALVPVRADHLPAILPVLARNRGIKNILIMVNTPKGYRGIIDMLGRDRFLLGFPGMGGGLADGVVTYVIAKPLVQPTTFGEIDGKTTKRLAATVAMFKRAGFPVAVERNMDAWQKTHVCWIMPFAAALYMAGSSAAALAERPDILRLMVRSIRECFRALRTMSVPVTPSKLRMFEWLPAGLLVEALRRQLPTPDIEIGAMLHVRNAPGEMRQLCDDLLSIVRGTSVKAGALEEIMSCVPRP